MASSTENDYSWAPYAPPNPASSSSSAPFSSSSSSSTSSSSSSSYKYNRHAAKSAVRAGLDPDGADIFVGISVIHFDEHEVGRRRHSAVPVHVAGTVRRHSAVPVHAAGSFRKGDMDEYAQRCPGNGGKFDPRNTESGVTRMGSRFENDVMVGFMFW